MPFSGISVPFNHLHPTDLPKASLGPGGLQDPAFLGDSRERTDPAGSQPQGDGVRTAAMAVRASRALIPTRHSLTDSTVSSRPRSAAPEQAASDATERCQPRQRRHSSGERRAICSSPTPDASLPKSRPVTSRRLPGQWWATRDMLRRS